MNAVAEDILTDDAISVWLLSANELLSGQVVYLTTNQQWSRDILDAHQYDDHAVAAQALEALEADQSVVLSPLIVDARRHVDKTLTMTHFRNRFRESGPTHRSY